MKSSHAQTRHAYIPALIGAAAALALAVAGPSAAAPAKTPQNTEPPNFDGVWRLDPSLGVILHPDQPGPQGLPRGWMGFKGYAAPNEPPPLRPEALATVKVNEDQELSGRPMDPRTAQCKYANIFDMMSWAGNIDIFQRRDEVVMLVERERTLPRHVYIGHQHPPADELTPAVNGHSVAHWEGDTLVVDTVGFEPGPFFMVVDFLPQSEDLHVVERLRLKDPDTLLSTWTITDPQVLTKPWVVNLVYRRQAFGTEMFEMVCDTNSRGFFVPPKK